MEVDPLTLRRRQHPDTRNGECVRVPSGSSKIVARLQRSGENERRVSMGDICAPRTRETSPLALSGDRQDVDVQLKEGVCESGEGSDPLIVVRDGRADHKAKGWAERQREHSTHDGKGLFPKTVSRSLLALVGRFGYSVSKPCPFARLSEEPCAGKSHAGICEGGAR